MALLRAVAAGLLLLAICVCVGRNGAHPVSTVVVTRAPTTTSSTSTTTVPPPTTSTTVRVLEARRVSRGELHRSQPNVSSDADRQQAIAIICEYDWSCDQAVRVASCESGLRWWARNPRSSATGIFQILRGPLDLRANIALAHSMWANRGWQPWNASRRCWA